MAYDRVYDYYNRLNDPENQQREIGRRVELARPELDSILSMIESRLNKQGLFSASPMTRARTRAATQFTGDITRGYYENLDEQRMGLLDLISRIEMAERERKSRERSSLFGGIGSLIGTGLSFIPGLGGSSDLDRLIQLLEIGGGGGMEVGDTLA